MDLLLVAQSGDLVAASVASEARAKGRVAVILDHLQAARMFTIVGDAEGSRVEPDVPMLFRPRAARRAPVSSDERFLQGETHAALWAAAALATSPVINRPTLRGFEGRWSPSGSVIEHRAAIPVGPEIYLRTRRRGAPPDGRAWALEPPAGRARRWLSGAKAGAVGRARPLLDGERYEPVVVLGGQAWRSSTVDLAGLDLERRSKEAVANLGLTFAVATWGIAGSRAEARLARIDPYPRPDQLLPVWSDVAPALMAVLGC